MPTIKEIAHHKVKDAWRRGDIAKARELQCVDCSKQALDYDHYLGYEPQHWLDVEPVCRSCHILRSLKRGEKPRQSARLRKRIGPLLKDSAFYSYRKAYGRRAYRTDGGILGVTKSNKEENINDGVAKHRLKERIYTDGTSPGREVYL